MGSNFSSGASRSNHRSNGFEWQGVIRFYDYTGESDLEVLQSLINSHMIVSAEIYKKPLSESQWIHFVFYHAFVVFETRNRGSSPVYWSLEKNGDALILQKSLDKKSVVNKIEGSQRLTTWYWEPKLMVNDLSDCAFEALYKFIIVDTDQLNMKYNFSDENCKKFAKIVFDKIARSKTWRYTV